MKILMVNKFLYPNGGSETYVFKLGTYLQSQGHEVQYFGMEHEGRCVGNHVEAYTRDMDFHNGSMLSKLTYPIKTIYNMEARKKIKKVLDDFNPNVVHLNNFNFQLTPSIILEIRKWEKETRKKVKIVYTAHDSQLVCPNHLMQNPTTLAPCTKCLEESSINCIKGKCIHNSLMKSSLGAIEKMFWNRMNVYEQIDSIISPSRFLAEKLATNSTLKNKIYVIHNFVDIKDSNPSIKTNEKKYILYFGRYSKEKGINTLLEVIKKLPSIPFVFAGNGPLESDINQIENINNLGFLTNDELLKVIKYAKFSITCSECYENCPFSVMESLSLGTPVIGANIGGIPELIQEKETGLLFKSGNQDDLKQKILYLWDDYQILNNITNNCNRVRFFHMQEYYQKLISLYEDNKSREKILCKKN